VTTITSTQLAADLSALVNRWNTREYQMIDFISKPQGTVTVTDGAGIQHTLPSFPQIKLDIDTQLAQGVKSTETAPQDITQRIPSGFYQRREPGPGWPFPNGGNWWHLISTTDGNTSNYYALQLSCNYFTQDLHFRSVNNDGAQAWSRIWHSGNFDPDAKLSTAGGTLSGGLNVQTSLGLKAATAGNAAIWLRDETSAHRAVLYWSRATDSLNLQRYDPVTSQPQGRLWINSAGQVHSTGPITAPGFNGNATSASKLSTSPTVNGTSFNGSANIVTQTWGAWRKFKIGAKEKSTNGSTDIAFSLPEIGAVANGGGVAGIKKLSQSTYDALASKDPNTLYIIV